MNPRALIVAALVLALAAGCAPKTPPAPPATAPAPDRAAWRSLFTGYNLDGWTATGTARWTIDQNGPWPPMIVGGQEGDPKRSGLLSTNDLFQNYELEFEFMIDEHGKYNSGVYLRNTPTSKNADRYQVNIGRGQAEEYCGGVFTDKWLAKGDETDTIRKPLDWNKLRILADGPHIVVHLNGKQIVDVTDDKPDPKKLQPGRIAFQTYGAENYAGWVKFRDIRIRELPDSPKAE